MPIVRFERIVITTDRLRFDFHRHLDMPACPAPGMEILGLLNLSPDLGRSRDRIERVAYDVESHLIVATLDIANYSQGEPWANPDHGTRGHVIGHYRDWTLDRERCWSGWSPS